jgi:hypothetical protein
MKRIAILLALALLVGSVTISYANPPQNPGRPGRPPQPMPPPPLPN